MPRQRFFVGNILQTFAFVEMATANETLFPLYVVDGVAANIRFGPYHVYMHLGCLHATRACQVALSCTLLCSRCRSYARQYPPRGSAHASRQAGGLFT